METAITGLRIEYSRLVVSLKLGQDLKIYKIKTTRNAVARDYVRIVHLCTDITSGSQSHGRNIRNCLMTTWTKSWM
jgi:hypothetical protein